MQIDKLAIAIRPRDNWEAADLGYRMVRQWWQAIYVPWIFTALGFASALFFICYKLEMLWLYVLLFWWFKPWYGRLPLYVISRKVFGEELSTQQSLRAVPTLSLTSPLWRLLLLRLSWNRAFDMPVVVLEGMKGQARRERLQILQRNVAGTMFWITLTGALLQWSVYVFLALLPFVFAPSVSELKWYEALFPFAHEDTQLLTYYALFAFTASIIIVEPYYIAIGFALYLNRRTLLEGWDIELAFHRMVDRIRTSRYARPAGLLAACLIGCVIGFSHSTSSYAALPAPSAREAKQKIEIIMKSDEFSNKQIISFYQYKFEEEKKKKPRRNDNNLFKFFRNLGSGFAVIVEALLWILLAALIIWLLLNHERWLNWLRGIRPPPPNAPPKQLFGLDIRPESLPEDIARTALQLWRNGNARGAMSLLYRGALSKLANEPGVTLKESYTEGDCLRVVKRLMNHQKTDYFKQLTQAWQMIAYADRPLANNAAEQLCLNYRQHFEPPQ